jgi:hypothetical protein
MAGLETSCLLVRKNGGEHISGAEQRVVVLF